MNWGILGTSFISGVMAEAINSRGMCSNSGRRGPGDTAGGDHHGGAADADHSAQSRNSASIGAGAASGSAAGFKSNIPSGARRH